MVDIPYIYIYSEFTSSVLVIYDSMKLHNDSMMGTMARRPYSISLMLFLNIYDLC